MPVQGAGDVSYGAGLQRNALVLNGPPATSRVTNAKGARKEQNSVAVGAPICMGGNT